MTGANSNSVLDTREVMDKSSSQTWLIWPFAVNCHRCICHSQTRPVSLSFVGRLVLQGRALVFSPSQAESLGSHSTEERQLRAQVGSCHWHLVKEGGSLSVPPSLGPGGDCALLIIRGTKNTLGPPCPHKALRKHSGAVDDDKTDGVTEIGVTHWRAHITSKNEAVNNAAPLPTFHIS